jgi:hypothetical protein
MIVFRVVVILVMVLLFATPEGLDSCAIGAPVPAFLATQGPPKLLEFLDGKLGVLRPSFAPRHLIAAFRILSGVPLTQVEKDSLYMDQRATGIGYNNPPQQWIEARQTVDGAGPAPQINPYASLKVKTGLIQSFENCKKDAFETAAASLEELRQAWGEKDTKLIDWVQAQDQVFANCSKAAPNIPSEPKPDADPLFAAYRRYQIAAARFYAGQFRAAAAAFDEIAKDNDSPWRNYGLYLAARSLLRAGLIDGDMDAFREGEQRLLAIASDPRLEDWHDSASSLVELWRIRVEPLKRAAELSRQLMTPGSEDISQAVIDLLYLVGNRVYGGGLPWSPQETTELETGSELAAWLLCMSSHPPMDAGERAVEWWRKHHHPAWLIAALAAGADKDMPELLAAAETIPPGSPAFESVAYHASLRAMGLGKSEQAIKLADLALQQKLELTSRNAFLQIRMRLARSLGEFFRFTLRRADPSLTVVEGHEIEAYPPFYQPPKGPVFDFDTVDAFNIQLPLKIWLQAAVSPTLPAGVRLRIAEAGWMRAEVLDRSEEARQFMEQIVALNPAAQSTAANYLTARDAKEAHFGAIFIVLRTPGLAPILDAPELTSPDLAHPRNYFTGGQPYRHELWNYGEGAWRKPSVYPLRFLSAVDRADAAVESKRIGASTPWYAAYLLRETLEWSQSHQEDSRVPEALHRAVMASFFRRSDGEMGKYSQKAWEMLHKRFPHSEWTARTPYWYK